MNPCGTFDRRYYEERTIVRTKTQWILLLLFIAILLVLPYLVDSFWLSTLNRTFIILIAVLGLNIVLGYCGQISLAQAAFMAVGAYACTILMQHSIPFLVAMPCAALICSVMGIIFGAPSLRVKGFYLVLSTLAAHFIIVFLILRPLDPITNGFNGLLTVRANIAGLVFNTDFKLYYLIFACAAIMLFFNANLARTKIGRAFVAIRDNDLAAEVMGINVFYYKLLAFAISAFYAGIAGSLFAVFQRTVHPDYFTLGDSIWYIAVVLVGGLGTMMGAILGTIFMQSLKVGLTISTPFLEANLPFLHGQTWAALLAISVGLVIVLFLIFEPRGLDHRWVMIKNWYRQWPFSSSLLSGRR